MSITINGLSDSQIEQFRSATEDILENVGFRVQHEELLKLAGKAGAVVDDADGTVRIPSAMLRELLAQATSTYDVSGVGGSEYAIGGDNQHCLAIVTDPWVVDYDTQQPRRPRLEDIRKHTIIAQKLDQVASVQRMDFPVSDVQGPASTLRALEEHLLHFGKHIAVYLVSEESLRQHIEICKILAQEQDVNQSRLMSMAVAVVSPLTLAEFNGDILLTACGNNFPVIPTVCPMAGATSPYTVASTLLVANAEAVFVAALAQLVKPGHPVLYHVGASVADMRSGHDQYYTLDKTFWKIAATQLARSYNLPVGAECGGTMTYRYDQQNGAEGMLFMLAAHASQANLICGIGSCYNANGMSAEMMLIQSAWLDAAKYLSKGMTIDDLHLGMENIRSAGPGGNFLTDDLTLQFMRGGEFFSNDLFDYSGSCEDSYPMLKRAHDKVEAMVADFESPVPPRVQEGLRRYFHNECAKVSA